MKTIDEIRGFFRDDRFATEQGIVIDGVGDGTAVCSVELGPGHLNAMGNAQGGLIFTLADFAFAVAVNHREVGTVTLNSTIHFLRPPKGKKLTATASCVNRSRTVCLYKVSVVDELGTLVADVSVTGYDTNSGGERKESPTPSSHGRYRKAGL